VSSEAIYLVTTWAIPVIVAITFHEAAHGFVAHLLGDDTAWRLGRVSFNPVKHIDPFGTILLPGMLLLFHAPFLFGYAKPVPVNFRALRSPRRDMVLARKMHRLGRILPKVLIFRAIKIAIQINTVFAGPHRPWLVTCFSWVPITCPPAWPFQL